MTRPSRRPSDLHGDAAHWYARMSSDVKTPADQAAFDAWVAAAPQHADAYAEACALAGRLDTLANHPDVATLRAEAQLFEERQRRPLVTRLHGGWATTAALAAAAAAAFFYFNSTPLETAALRTARGETRAIVLSDGSHVVLGSDSRIEMRFWRRERDISLERGQAFFDVVHENSRPFVVAAGGRAVTALGTAFDVRVYLNETTVTLVRGSVAIARPDEENEAVLKPGQQFRISSDVASVRDVNASAETSWRTGVLQFDGVTLSEAVTEFNRSAPNSIVLADPRLGEFHVSGVFRANDVQGFAAALVPAYPITVDPQSSGDVVLRYRAGAPTGR